MRSTCTPTQLTTRCIQPNDSSGLTPGNGSSAPIIWVKRT